MGQHGIKEPELEAEREKFGDKTFPEYEMISETKKIDFILWANR